MPAFPRSILRQSRFLQSIPSLSSSSTTLPVFLPRSRFLSITTIRLAIQASPEGNAGRKASSVPTDPGEKKIYEKLKERFGGKELDVQDVSGGCGSFYAIHISSPQFNSLSTIKQHRLVNECLKEEVKGIHGLQLKTVPEEE